MKRIHCFQCHKTVTVQNCGKCREITKSEIVEILLGMDPVYLTERNRNKKGRKSKLTATQKSDLAAAHRYENLSFEVLGKRYGIHSSTACRIYHKEYDNVVS